VPIVIPIRLTLAIIAIGVAALAPAAGYSQTVTFTEDQASAGRLAYDMNCATCHGVHLEGAAVAPGLAGEGFALKWSNVPVVELFTQVQRMPPGNPAELTQQTYQDIVAYLLLANGESAGSGPLVASGLLPEIAGHGGSVEITASMDESARQLLANMRTVTDELLNNPPASDWLLWHRSYDNQGYSSLNQINRDTVARLQSSWRVPLLSGENNPGPIVHDGVMFLFTYPDTVLAIDAGNGALLWRYQHATVGPASQKKGIALYGDMVLVPTSDMHVLALNARTGELIWDHTIATEEGLTGYRLRSAPFIVGDTLMQGVAAINVPKGGFVVALDIDTGAEAWRFHTIPRPGEPGFNSWNDLPMEARSGGSVWNQGAYDEELNLVYFGNGPTYDTGPLLYPVDTPGITNDALYTNATVALNPDTGALVWYFQHLANDQWDLDWAFERQLVDIEFEGEMRRVVMTVGKAAILDALDAATGEYLFSIDMGLQNIVTAIDPETGAKTKNPLTFPSLETTRLICPNHYGSKSWPPAAFNPDTKQLYLPLNEGCLLAGPEGYGLLSSGVRMAAALHPDSNGQMGRLQAIDLEQQAFTWRHRQPSPVISSLLATAGGLVFAGDMDRWLKAFDDRNGELLWQTRLDAVPSSTIVTYAIDGRQYVAVVVGQSNYHVTDWARVYDLLIEEQGLSVDEPTAGSAGIWVFALP